MNQVSKQPLFFCPWAKFKDEEDEFSSIQFRESLYIFNTEYEKSTFHTRPLNLCNNKDGTYDDFSCEICVKPLYGTIFYSCKECLNVFSSSKDGYFHKKCIEPISKHPYHPKHTLRLHYNYLRNICLYCSCIEIWVYSCSICAFTFCHDCERKRLLLSIYHPKRHEHILFYIPRNSSMSCDVCALSEYTSLMYSCLRCDFVVHKNCVNMPCIIKISRHEHRLSFNSLLTPGKWYCGVCREKIDINYGRYFCAKDCSYGVHSKCATREDIWDGKELEGEPEDVSEDIKSFNEISDGIIQHFSHPNHHMRLDEKIDKAFDENNHCQACTLPIYDDIVYNCMQCEFFLHQECAHLPQKKQYATHPHHVRLRVDHSRGGFKCDACRRKSNGFGYQCYYDDCDFLLDVCCASITDPCHHQCHPHPLFLTSKPKTQRTCSICHESEAHCLNCGECDFILCFRCVTLPKKSRYKYDEHFLILFYEKDASGQYLCEVCEEEADLKKGIYICKDCNIIVHIQCLLGEEMYMKSGRILCMGGRNVNILLNNHLTRNTCIYCTNRCKKKTVYKLSDIEILCSFECLKMYLNSYCF